MKLSSLTITHPPPRPPVIGGRCALCGWQALKGSDYCKAHQWAAK